ncbi:hypothetical protein RJT34_04295 [Clitoria ternatea]|uniref:S-protein homolog n=1 Tax=Clitoria ternatea TaxID=43366 RepID=A0AAN9KLB9_CLITE
MSISNYVAIVTALVLASSSLCNGCTHEIRIHVDKLPNIPSHTRDVVFNCDTGGLIIAFADSESDHRFNISVDKPEGCSALWANKVAYFSAYDPHYDRGNAIIYWWAKLDGFYHSWDRVHWVKKACWGFD